MEAEALSPPYQAFVQFFFAHKFITDDDAAQTLEIIQSMNLGTRVPACVWRACAPPSPTAGRLGTIDQTLKTVNVALRTLKLEIRSVVIPEQGGTIHALVNTVWRAARLPLPRV
jgi:hypothetical protein